MMSKKVRSVGVGSGSWSMAVLPENLQMLLPANTDEVDALRKCFITRNLRIPHPSNNRNQPNCARPVAKFKKNLLHE